MSSISYPTSRPRRFSFEQALIALLMGLLMFCVSLALLVIGYQFLYAGRIFPGVTVGGIDVGGLKPSEADLRVNEGMQYPQHGKILLRDGERIWLASPAQLGLYLDPQTSATNAFEVGRSEWMVDRLRTQFYTWYSGEDLPPSMVFDERAAYAYLLNLSKEVNEPTIEASLSMNGTEVVAQPGKIGRSLDLTKNLQAISAQLQTMRDGVINLTISDNPPVILDASQQADLARQILSQPLTLSMPEAEAGQAGPWTIDPQTLAPMLTFERVQNDNGALYQVKLDGEKLRSFLNDLSPKLLRQSQNAHFTFNDDTHQLEVLQASVTGRELDIDGTIQTVEEKLPAGEHSIPLAIKYVDPPVTDKATADSLGIHELVSSYTSYFYGSSSSRVQNITTAASKFHGLLVAPGETFSMASAIGDITLDNGYAEALIIIGGQTIAGVGGGVCQVSTTLFRTAFFGGLPIVERHAHAYRVYYYEKEAGNHINTDLAGLDATVYVPIVDFKFTNDTSSWLLMETYVNPSNSSLTWKFYSTSDGRSVDWNTTGITNVVPAPEPVYRENPELANGQIKQVDWSADGSDVTVNRTVTRNGQIYLQDTIYTHYEPWADVYEYGPGTDIPSGDSGSKPEG